MSAQARPSLERPELANHRVCLRGLFLTAAFEPATPDSPPILSSRPEWLRFLWRGPSLIEMGAHRATERRDLSSIAAPTRTQVTAGFRPRPLSLARFRRTSIRAMDSSSPSHRRRPRPVPCHPMNFSTFSYSMICIDTLPRAEVAYPQQGPYWLRGFPLVCFNSSICRGDPRCAGRQSFALEEVVGFSQGHR